MPLLTYKSDDMDSIKLDKKSSNGLMDVDKPEEPDLVVINEVVSKRLGHMPIFKVGL